LASGSQYLYLRPRYPRGLLAQSIAIDRLAKYRTGTCEGETADREEKERNDQFHKGVTGLNTRAC